MQLFERLAQTQGNQQPQTMALVIQAGHDVLSPSGWWSPGLWEMGDFHPFPGMARKCHTQPRLILGII